MKWPKATNSGYASLVQAGMSALVAFTDNSGEAEAYNRSYATATQRRNALEAQHVGELNISSARMSAIRERTSIGMTQDIAEANLRVNAAAAGVGGGSVQDSIYQTEANAAYRVADAGIKESNSMEDALSKVYAGAQGARLQTDEYGGSMLGSLMKGIGSLDGAFYKDLGLAFELGNETNTVENKLRQPAVGWGR